MDGSVPQIEYPRLEKLACRILCDQENLSLIIVLGTTYCVSHFKHDIRVERCESSSQISGQSSISFLFPLPEGKVSYDDRRRINVHENFFIDQTATTSVWIFVLPNDWCFAKNCAPSRFDYFISRI